LYPTSPAGLVTAGFFFSAVVGEAKGRGGNCTTCKIVVVPAQAGIHFAFHAIEKIKMDSRLRGNDVMKGYRSW
jgi:hypothetical protein